MKSPAGCTRSPGMNKTVPRYQWYPYPYPGYFNNAVPGTRIFCRGRTELTKVPSTDMDEVVPSLLPTDGNGCFTKLTKGSGMVRLLVPVPGTRPRVLQQGHTRYQGIFQREHQTYQSVGYGQYKEYVPLVH